MPLPYTRQCLGIGMKNCHQEYYDLNIKSYPKSGSYWQQYARQYYTVSFELRATKLPIMVYNVSAKTNLVLLASNLGGLMAIWFVMAAIDFRKIISYLLDKFKLILMNLLNFRRLLLCIEDRFGNGCLFKLVMMVKWMIMGLFRLLDIMKAGIAMRYLSLIVFSYQVSHLIVTYLQFKTEVSVGMGSV